MLNCSAGFLSHPTKTTVAMVSQIVLRGMNMLVIMTVLQRKFFLPVSASRNDVILLCGGGIDSVHGWFVPSLVKLWLLLQFSEFVVQVNEKHNPHHCQANVKYLKAERSYCDSHTCNTTQRDVERTLLLQVRMFEGNFPHRFQQRFKLNQDFTTQAYLSASMGRRVEF